MERLDTTSKKILFVQRDEALVAALTDGDIRRWILAKGDLNAFVKDFANYSPIYLYESTAHKAKVLMYKKHIEAIPVVDEDKKIISIIFQNEKEIKLRETLNIPVVIMAGGLGTRLYPYTKILPKPLIPIGEIPVTEHIINRFCQYGARQFFLIVNHKKNMIKAYFNEVDKEYELQYVEEPQPLGTGGGLSLLKDKISSTFILSNCDILIEEDYVKIFNYHKGKENLITMVCSLKNISIPYGVIEIDGSGEIINMKEKPQLSFLANTGMYIVEPQVIQELEGDLSIGFPNIIEKHRINGKKIGIYPISEKSWLDMGELGSMEKMKERFEK
ncbi:MAG: Nucleoside-diphosphate-sugar pyrophosphorylase family protein [Bacillota bacterium]|jgi:dTDP-glucose pyrophosphorylase|nr:Nucleoside-diphosphate-sugar pyrophosphorylase family protein [Bacillota bacterium]